jgi:hypothetical protein
MRKVQIFKTVQVKNEKGGFDYPRVEDCIAKFHYFGCDYEEFETGPGNFSTAICELEDGSVRNVPLHMIKFI